MQLLGQGVLQFFEPLTLVTFPHKFQIVSFYSGPDVAGPKYLGRQSSASSMIPTYAHMHFLYDRLGMPSIDTFQ